MPKCDVQFKSTAFNCTEPRDYFINDCCFGDDLCRWLIAHLRAAGITTDDEPGQEDFGWYFGFAVAGVPHLFILGFQPNDPATGDQWLGTIERPQGLLKRLFGSGPKGVLPEAIAAIDAVLQNAPEIREVRWYSAKAGERET